MDALKEKGMLVDTDVLTVEEAASKLIACLEKEVNNA